MEANRLSLRIDPSSQHRHECEEYDNEEVAIDHHELSLIDVLVAVVAHPSGHAEKM